MKQLHVGLSLPDGQTLLEDGHPAWSGLQLPYPRHPAECPVQCVGSNHCVIPVAPGSNPGDMEPAGQ